MMRSREFAVFVESRVRALIKVADFYVHLLIKL